MSARLFNIPAWVLGLVLALGFGGAAYAQCCAPPPPPCCAPPPPCCRPPSPPQPPSPPCCHGVNIPGVSVNVGANVIVNASAQAFAIAGGSARGGAVFFGGGGGSSWSTGPGGSGLIQGLIVEDLKPTRAAYQASRTKVRIVIIRAVCIDDRQVPHPASQVTPDRDIGEGFEGELYRCLAGSRMQVTLADYKDSISFDGGETIMCAKGEALYRSRTGEVACRPQSPQRDCFERSLLRRYGAGVKILKIVTVETYTAYREETVATSSASTFNMSIDGGVGGIAY